MRQHHRHDPMGLGYYTWLCVISGNHHIAVLYDLDNIDNILVTYWHARIPLKSLQTGIRNSPDWSDVCNENVDIKFSAHDAFMD